MERASVPRCCRLLVLKHHSHRAADRNYLNGLSGKLLRAGNALLGQNEEIEHFRAELQSILAIANSLQQMQG